MPGDFSLSEGSCSLVTPTGSFSCSYRNCYAWLQLLFPSPDACFFQAFSGGKALKPHPEISACLTTARGWLPPCRKPSQRLQSQSILQPPSKAPPCSSYHQTRLPADEPELRYDVPLLAKYLPECCWGLKSRGVGALGLQNLYISMKKHLTDNFFSLFPCYCNFMQTFPFQQYS